MIQDRVLKIIKGLNIFSSDDLVSMTDIDEYKVDEIIVELVREEKITPIGNQYKYLNKDKCQKPSLRLLKKTDKKIFQDKNINFKEAAEYFLINYALQICTPSTFKSYKSIIYTHLIIFFKSKNIREINFKDIQDFVELKHKEKLSEKTIKNSLALLGKMFNYFKEQGFINENPYSGIVNLKVSSKENIRILSKEETESLLDLAKRKYPYLFSLILFALSTGLKKSEILPLTKNDINLTNQKININKTIYEGQILEARNDRILREADIPEDLLSMFEELIKGKQNTDFIFKTSRLNMLTLDNRTRQHFRELAKELGLYDFKFNDLRHTYAYNSLQNGISIDYLHKQLGDYSIQSTMDKYRDFINPKIDEVSCMQVYTKNEALKVYK